MADRALPRAVGRPGAAGGQAGRRRSSTCWWRSCWSASPTATNARAGRIRRSSSGSRSDEIGEGRGRSMRLESQDGSSGRPSFCVPSGSRSSSSRISSSSATRACSSAHSFTRGGITVYSDEPIPPESAGRDPRGGRAPAGPEPAGGPARIKDLRIYICNRRWRFVLFANFRYKVGGLAYRRSPTISSSGRSTSTRIAWSAHRARRAGRAYPELLTWPTRSCTSWSPGSWGSSSTGGSRPGRTRDTPTWWPRAGNSTMSAREQLRRGDRELDPKRSGLYLRYHLLVAYLLERKGIGVGELLGREFDPAAARGGDPGGRERDGS